MSSFVGRALRSLARTIGAGLALGYYYIRRRVFQPIFWLSDVMNGLAIVLLVIVVAKNVTFVESEKHELTRAIYHEARGQPLFAQHLVAYIIVERARENRSYWGGNTIQGVVNKTRTVIDKKTGKKIVVAEFSFILLPAHLLLVKDKDAWQVAERVAREVYHRRFTPPGELALARYYMNPRAVQKCRTKEWFYKNLFLLQVHHEVARHLGDHEFFREPQTEKEKAVTKTETDVCSSTARLLQRAGLSFL